VNREVFVVKFRVSELYSDATTCYTTSLTFPYLGIASLKHICAKTNEALDLAIDIQSANTLFKSITRSIPCCRDSIMIRPMV
jgi:hypothetical protein